MFFDTMESDDKQRVGLWWLKGGIGIIVLQRVLQRVLQ